MGARPRRGRGGGAREDVPESKRDWNPCRGLILGKESRFRFWEALIAVVDVMGAGGGGGPLLEFLGGIGIWSIRAELTASSSTACFVAAGDLDCSLATRFGEYPVLTMTGVGLEMTVAFSALEVSKKSSGGLGTRSSSGVTRLLVCPLAGLLDDLASKSPKSKSRKFPLKPASPGRCIIVAWWGFSNSMVRLRPRGW